MTNLKYRVDSDEGLSDGHVGEDAPTALSDGASLLAQPSVHRVMNRAIPLTREPDTVKAERIMEEIEAASASRGAQSILASSSAAVRDAGCVLPSTEGQQKAGQPGSGRQASDKVENSDAGPQWMLPSLLSVLTISLGIFFLVTFIETRNPDPGVDGAGVPATAPHDQSALASTTRSKLAELNRQVVFWMTQYSDGFDPRKVRLKRVREDLALSSDQMLDSWGRPIKYEAADAGYTLRSSGADKEFNTGDDLVELQPQFPSRLQPVRGQ